MVGQRPLKPLIGVRIPVSQLVKKMHPRGCIFCYKLEISTVRGTVRQGFEDLACYFVTERKQNSDKVYCSCNERNSLYPSQIVLARRATKGFTKHVNSIQFLYCMANLKLKLKFNALEFEIEGEENVVREEFDKFKGFLATEFVNRQPGSIRGGSGDEQDAVLLGQGQPSDFPILSEVVKKDLPNSEPEWVLVYAFYASNYGEDTFSEQGIKNGYETSKRTNASRMANLSNSIKQILNKDYIKMLSDVEYIFLDKGKEKARLILSGSEPKLSSSKKNTKKKSVSKSSETKVKKGSKAKNLKPEQFEILPEGKISLEAFLNDKKPGDTARERILVIAYYIKNVLEEDSFSDGNIEYAYKALSLKNKPIHLRQVITNIKNDQLEIDSVDGNWVISRIGEKFVDEKLPSSKDI